MAVTLQDVQHIAGLARIGLSPAHAATLVAELNTILGHMEVLARVDTEGVQPSTGVGAGGLQSRSDSSGAVPLARSLDAFAPALRDGLLLVPRLSTHESTEDA